MLLPLDWLREYIPKLPAPKKLAELLMMHGLEVEEIIDRPNQYEHVVVGEIVAIKPHPNADKLRLADVLVKKGERPIEIVCGAPNIEVGQKAPVALLGAKLPSGRTIAKRSIRGVESNGMLCAADELGMNADHAGILVLDAQLKVGTPLAEALGLDQPVFDIATPANRSDLMSVRGLAWEISAMLGKPMQNEPLKLVEGKTAASQSLQVSVTAPQLCSLLTARVIRGVTIKSTPPMIVERLKSAGMRSVNIIVDITNYIMLEYGQPLHAYDAALLPGGKLVARAAKTGEPLMTLDGQMRQLVEGMLVITDGERIIDLAGVMGGAETAISAKTADIILEAGIFDPVSVRRTSRQFGLLSEASKRFEKGLWPSLSIQASSVAAAMIVQHCGGIVEQGIVQAGTSTSRSQTIKMNPNYVTERLGMTVSPAKSKTILTKLGFMVKGTTKSWVVTVPAWRLDVSLPEDVVDEIGRMVGYEKLPRKMPPLNDAPGPLPVIVEWKDTIRQALTGLGFTEVITHSYYGERSKKTVEGEHVEVANPLDATQQYLRRSLVPSTKSIIESAIDAGRDAKVFEISRVFLSTDTTKLVEDQPWKLVIGIAIKPREGYVPGHQLELYLQELWNSLRVTSNIYGSQEILDLGDTSKGRVIEISEFDISEKLKFRQRKQTTSVIKYPSITRDISFWWTKDETAMREAINGLKLALLRDFKITDRFTKDDRTSYTVSFVYQSPDRTLTKEEVDKLEQKIKDSFEKLGATIR